VLNGRFFEDNCRLVSFVLGLIFGISLGRGFFLIFHLFKLTLEPNYYFINLLLIDIFYKPFINLELVHLDFDKNK
jgi:hypothetical protein